MYIRNYQGKIISFDPAIYPDENSLYTALWKIMYNINIAKNIRDFNKNLINFIAE